jgi:hypothetical protein
MKIFRNLSYKPFHSPPYLIGRLSCFLSLLKNNKTHVHPQSKRALKSMAHMNLIELI